MDVKYSANNVLRSLKTSRASLSIVQDETREYIASLQFIDKDGTETCAGYCGTTKTQSVEVIILKGFILGQEVCMVCRLLWTLNMQQSGLVVQMIVPKHGPLSSAELQWLWKLDLT